jgi:hypothetical protein
MVIRTHEAIFSKKNVKIKNFRNLSFQQNFQPQRPDITCAFAFKMRSFSQISLVELKAQRSYVLSETFSFLANSVLEILLFEYYTICLLKIVYTLIVGKIALLLNTCISRTVKARKLKFSDKI